MTEAKRLVTLKKGSELTGASIRFFQHLLASKKLTRYKINSALFISLTEFEEIAVAQKIS